MSSLVGAVKTYAYMDRGELVDVDLHEGLETTLIVLGHRLKHTSIQVVRDYDRDLPRLIVRGSELNQVWTNLLANAIDALGESGTITISTGHDDGFVHVDIADDGPGIPPEFVDQIFDSFFTTKDVGDGTGLGLATARNIVVDRHDGSLTVESRAGPDGLRSPAAPQAHLTEGQRMPPICTHVDQVRITQLPESVDGCVDCLAMGSLWLHLRICLECGHVGCCDDSPNRHATAHARRDGRTRSSARSSPARTGAGASSTRSACSSRPCTGRRASRRRRCSGERERRRDGCDSDLSQAPARLEAGDPPALRRAELAARVEGVTSRADVDAQALARRARDRARCRSCCSGRVSGSTGDGSWRSCKASRSETAQHRLS